MRFVHLLAAPLWLGAMLAGCGGVEPVEPHQVVTDPTQLFMRLRLNHRAVNLSTAAPYNTVQLTATPLNAAGQPMSGLPAPTFRSSDTNRVRVSADGLVQARAAGTNIRVIAELVADGNVKQVDTALVNVTANPTPPTLTTFSIDPVPPDSGVWGMRPSSPGAGTLQLFRVGIIVQLMVRARALDQNGNVIPGLAVAFESLDPDIIRINERTGAVGDTPMRLGTGRVVGRTFAYGVAMVDTAEFRMTNPVIHGVDVAVETDGTRRLKPSDIVIRKGGYVFWTNSQLTPVEVTFDDPSNVLAVQVLCTVLGGYHCDQGNIPAFDGSLGFLEASRGRRFPVPGVYRFDVPGVGSGRITVVDE